VNRSHLSRGGVELRKGVARALFAELGETSTKIVAGFVLLHRDHEAESVPELGTEGREEPLHRIDGVGA
jgi:hypothetical protein